MIPPIPPARDSLHDSADASVFHRYEDIAQNDRLQLTAMVPGFATAVWHGLLLKLPLMTALLARGIVPVLRRLIIVGDDRPVSVSVPVRYTGALRFAREAADERVFVNMWAEGRAPSAGSFDLGAPQDAAVERVGRVFAEHVLTRPFGPADERRVVSRDVPELSLLPEVPHAFESAEGLLEGPPLEDAGRPHFTLMHTDPSQHVNSLVYPRLVEEAVGRRVAEPILARALEVRWRRPFLAGEVARLALRVAPAGAGGEPPGAFEAAAAFYGQGTKPSCTVKMWLA